MRQCDIVTGTTYILAASDSPARQHLVGERFTVYRKERVWRRLKGRKGRQQVWRNFNDDGIGAPADELEPLEKSCHVCGKDAEFCCQRCGRPACEACCVPHTAQRPMEETRCRTCDNDPF